MSPYIQGSTNTNQGKLSVYAAQRTSDGSVTVVIATS